jgi:hypothetical protein
MPIGARKKRNETLHIINFYTFNFLGSPANKSPTVNQILRKLGTGPRFENLGREGEDKSGGGFFSCMRDSNLFENPVAFEFMANWSYSVCH